MIEAYDYDMLFGDDLIGKTTIDLDDRFFSPEWRSIKNKFIDLIKEIYKKKFAKDLDEEMDLASLIES